MSASRNAERVALVVLATLVVWDTWQLRRNTRTVDDLVERVAMSEAKLKQAGDLRSSKVPMSSFSPDLFKPRGGGATRDGGAHPSARSDATAPEGEAATPPRAQARAKRRSDVPAVPGAQVLSRLYDAADEMAADEQWSNETYEQVALVFEDATAQMKDLFDELKAKKVTPAQAKEQALRLRDDATGKLAGVLGKDGLQRLKGYIKDDAGPVGPR